MLIAKSKPIEGTVISTDFQSAGRGQRNNIWQSSKADNLLFTIILYPAFLKVRHQFYLSMLISNAIIGAIEKMFKLEKLSVKWPNDIYIQDKKLGGVLIQNNLKGDRIASSVIGVGLNVNQTIFDPELPNPVSLSLLLKQNIDRKILMKQIFSEMDSRYLSLKLGHFKKLKSTYEERLYNRGELSRFSAGGVVHEGVILGVEEDGRILVNIEGKVKKRAH